MSTTDEWIARTLEGIEASLDTAREEHLEQLKRIADALERIANVAECVCEHFEIDYPVDLGRERK